jgi:hypothetical protein
MNDMNHKEYLEYLKENDPILYYELTSNPTGVDSDNHIIYTPLVFIIVLIIMVVLFSI